MGKLNDAVSKEYDNNEKFAKAYDVVNDTLGSVGKSLDMCLDLDTIISDEEQVSEEKSMYIDRVFKVVNEEKKHYFRLRYENSEGELSTQCLIEIMDSGSEDKSDLVGMGFISEIQQLAYMGYHLRQSKTWEETEIKQ